MDCSVVETIMNGLIGIVAILVFGVIVLKL